MRAPTHSTYAAAPAGARAAPAAIRQDRSPRRQASATATHTAAATAAPTGRVSPAAAASRPAASHRPRRAPYRAQAASAVNSDSLYAMDCTMPTGSAAQAATAHTPARRPSEPRPRSVHTRRATAKIPQAAASPATAETTRPAEPYDSPVGAATSRSSQGSSGKKARFEWTAPFGRATSYPYPSAAIRAYQSESHRADSSVRGLLPTAAHHTASAPTTSSRTAAKTARAGPASARAGAARRNERSFTRMIIGGARARPPEAEPRAVTMRVHGGRRGRRAGVRAGEASGAHHTEAAAAMRA